MRRGFSLIETLICFALAAFLMAGTTQLMLRAAYLKKISDILTASAGLARDRLSLLRSQPFEGPLLSEGEHEDILTDPSTGRSFRLTWDVELTGDETKTVRVRAAPARTQERGVELVLLLDRSLGF